MNNIIIKGIIFILVFVPSLIFSQNKLPHQQTEIVLSEEELQLLLQKVAEAKLRKIRSEKLTNLHKSQQKEAVSNIYKSNEIKNFYYLAQHADSTHTDVEQLNRKMDLLLAYMMKKDSISVIHVTDTVKYVIRGSNTARRVANNNPNKAKQAANNPNTAKQVANNNPNTTKNVANNSNEEALQKQLSTIYRSVNDLSNQQKQLAVSIAALAALNNKDKLDKIQQHLDSVLLVSKKQTNNQAQDNKVRNNEVQHNKVVNNEVLQNEAQQHEAQQHEVAAQRIAAPVHNEVNTVISEERRRTLEDLLAKYGHKKTPIYFANNAYSPLPHDTEAISQIVNMLNDNPELSILLEGYASDVGSSAYNNQLSMRRSESVARLLEQRGIALQRILTAFRGIDHSVDKEKARRVDISVIIR